MSDDQTFAGDDVAGGSLRARAREGELERQLSSLRLNRSLFKWVYLPVASLGFVVALALAVVRSVDLGVIVGGLIAVGGGVAGLTAAFRGLRDQIAQLETEQASLGVGRGVGRKGFPRAGSDEPPGV